MRTSGQARETSQIQKKTGPNNIAPVFQKLQVVMTGDSGGSYC
jgi:hypothetical protein